MQLPLGSFITRQIDRILAAEWLVLQRTLKKLVLSPLNLSLIVLIFPFVLLIHLLRPFVMVRIGSVDKGRIGSVYVGDWYLSEKLDGKHCGRYLDFFYFHRTTNHVNRQWEKMWRRVLPSVPGSQFWKIFLRLNRLLPGYGQHEIPRNMAYVELETWRAHLRDPGAGWQNVANDRLQSILKNTNPNISFNAEEERQGRAALKSLGIPNDKPYICFHARDSTYLDTVANTWDWSYHNYRDSRIQNYVPAAEEMASRGYYAVRMGAVVKEGFRSPHPRVIDYATSGGRTDFNDVYIGSHCRFFLCSDGGMSIFPEMFRVPAVYVNWTSILRISTWALNGLFIFKKFYLRNEHRYMTVSEIMSLRFGGNDTNENFARWNLELIENTPEEIHAVTVEMDERLNGTWESTQKDVELQKRFWALFGPGKLKSQNLRIGAEYLRQNSEALR